MKLLYITNGVHGTGGLERVLAVKTNNLIEEFNYEVVILTLNSANKRTFYKFNPKVKFYDVQTSGNPFAYLFKYKKGIEKIIKKVNPNIISVCDDGAKGLLFPIIIGKKKPLVYERHASINFNFIKKEKTSFLKQSIDFVNRKLMLFGARRFDEFIVLTKGNINDWPEINCTVIPNPSPFNIGSLECEKEKIVLAVGTQSFNKGYDRLINVWDKINKKHPNWKLKIFGKQNLKKELQGKINLLKLNEKIELNDPIKNIENEYRKASIFALSSRTEGFGMVLVEAMTFGVPCVAFDCPHGPKDIIKNNEDGYLVENNNLVAFSKALSVLIENKELRLKMGGKAKENVKRYSSSNVASQWDMLFNRILE